MDLKVAMNRVAVLEAQIKTLTTKPDVRPSEYFLNAQRGEQKIGGLSETKRNLERIHPELLVSLLGGKKVTNKEFNHLLVAALKKVTTK